MEKPGLLIVEDDEDIHTQMKWGLAQDYEVSTAENYTVALDTFRRTRPAVVTLDLGLPPRPLEVEEGFRTLGGILQEDPRTKVVIITGRNDRKHALRAIDEGAYDFFPKPIHMEDLKVTLRRALHIYDLEREQHEVQRRQGEEAFARMLGASQAMRKVFATIRKVAPTDAPVLILGESGCGKELVARAIHEKSARSGEAWVVINCGAIPENLLESELFGHEKGSFTGAHVQRKGRIEAAQGGSLFLDEIGELPLPLQVKLLRFLQERQIERVGGREPIAVDVRVIAATNVDLEQAMRDGSFREDLYYRLGVVTIPVPPLRERGGDIALLAKALVHRFSEEYGRQTFGFTDAAHRALEGHPWPGNVREMENRIKRAVIMADGKKLTAADLELTESAPAANQGLKLARAAVERDLVAKALERHRGNVTRAAADLGISRPTLYELIEKLGLKRG